MSGGESILASTLYAIFSLITTAGVFLITDHFQSRRVAIAAAALSVILFAALLVGLVFLVDSFDPRA